MIRLENGTMLDPTGTLKNPPPSAYQGGEPK
jgi:hypothetical protein